MFHIILQYFKILCKFNKNFGFFPDKFVFLQQKSLFLKKMNKIMRKNIIIAVFVALDLVAVNFAVHDEQDIIGRSESAVVHEVAELLFDLIVIEVINAQSISSL